MGAQASYRASISIGKEATKGTAVPPTVTVPMSKFTPKDHLEWITDENLRGSAVKTYGRTPGPLYAEHDFEGDVFADTLPFFLAGLLGDVAVTGASAPFTTTMSILNTGSTQGPSLTVVTDDPIQPLSFAGMTMEEVGLKFDGGSKFTWSGKGKSFASTITTAPTKTISAVRLQAGWEGIHKIGGTVSATIMDGEISLKRAVDLIQTSDGTQAPYDLFQGPVEADGKLTVVMDVDTYRAQYVAGTPGSFTLNFQQGAGAALTQVQVQASKTAFTEAAKELGKSFVTLSLSLGIDANSTDVGTSGGYSPVKVTIQNAMPTGTYK